ncbi:MAG: hypothetical protein WCJ30_09970 [Deltaproteobacteria bacterium]
MDRSTMFLFSKAVRNVLLGLSAAVSVGSCARTDYQHTIPFTCSNGTCPAGFRCSSSYCIQDDAPALPNLVQRSTARFIPTMRRDPDRNGMLTCWTREEEAGVEAGSVYGSFMTADGTVSAAVPLASFDTRGITMLVDCAPIPGTNGKILVAAWLQRYGVGEIQLAVWSPNENNGIEGSARAFYVEAAPIPQLFVPASMLITVVGDRVWVPFQQALPTGAGQPSFHVLRLRVGAAELAAGAPIRDEIVPRTSPGEFYLSRFFGVGSEGAWLQFGSLFSGFGFFSDTGTGTASGLLRSGVPASNPGFPFPIGASTVMGPMGPLRQLAMLWNDSLEPATIGQNYRIVWGSEGVGLLSVGPRLPFSRLDTIYPATMVRDGSMYVFGSPTVPVPPASLDAGDDAAVDASTTDIADVADRPDANFNLGPLVMYRYPWGASDGTAAEVVRTIPRSLGSAVVPAASAQAFPDNRHFGLAWVEFYPPDSSGHGARYALYMQRFEF